MNGKPTATASASASSATCRSTWRRIPLTPGRAPTSSSWTGTAYPAGFPACRPITFPRTASYGETPSTWSVPYGAPNARGGKWVTGPGRSLFARLKRALPGLSIVAEDLGEVNDQVRRLIDYTGYPGMRVLCYGFGGGADNPHHPANHVQNAVLYTGTHDNDTLRGYLTGAGEQELKSAREALGFTSVEDGIDAFVTACFRSPCDTCVIPMQDLLGLGTEARMNLPGTVGGNWLWRMKEGAFTGDIQRRVLELNQRYGRMNPQ